MKNKIIVGILLFTISSFTQHENLEEINLTSLINTTEVISSENCENGGTKIDTGIDINLNGVLEENEVSNTSYICNGSNGNHILINTTEVISSENCENGGTKIDTGIDINLNGILEENEISNTNYICNGINGNNSLIIITDENIGENCINGGYKIETGIDKNSNEILDTIEIENTNFICNSDSNNHQSGKTVRQASLTNGNIIEITDFPYHLKKGLSMSFYADITSLTGSVSYGKGFDKYRGEYLTIDDTNIYYYFDSVLRETKAHGLIINSFIKSSFYVDDSSVAHVILQSLTGTYQTTFQFNYRMNFAAFFKSDGQDVSNLNLSCVSKEFQNSIWAFGDSYIGVATDRWPGRMKDFGYFNFMINGLAGQSPAGAYADLERSLKYGTPKYLLWSLGMNGTEDSYQTYLNLVIDKCSELDITLILTTIPTVPNINRETIKFIVESSGYRYVDFYKAVGTDEEGNWYPGYIAGDDVHPTILGAQALAGQILVDFPEFMQYGKTF